LFLVFAALNIYLAVTVTSKNGKLVDVKAIQIYRALFCDTSLMLFSVFRDFAALCVSIVVLSEEGGPGASQGQSDSHQGQVGSDASNTDIHPCQVEKGYFYET
jgi:hypothetical protein